MQYKNGKNHHLPQILIILVASIAAFNEGMMYAWTSPSIPTLIEDESNTIDLEQASYFTVISPIAMAATAPLFSFQINKFGRKMAVVILAVPLILTWIITALANSIWLFYAARLCFGVLDAVFFATLPLYIGEISEPAVRGTWGNMLSISMYVGKFAINTIGAFASIKITALISGSIALLYGALSVFVPESPYFLIMKGKESEAKDSLRKLRWRDDVEEEFDSLKSDVKRQMSETGSVWDIFKISSNRKALFICLALRTAQQYSGLAAFETYTQFMFQQAGGDVPEKMCAIIFTGVFVPCIVLCAILVDKFGRRPLMIFSSLGCATVLTVETIYFCLKQFTQIDLSSFGWLPLVGMLIFIIICSTGLGILPTLMLGELLSASVKGKALAIIVTNHALHSLIVPKLFQTLTSNYGLFAPFLFFSCCTFMSALFSYLYIVETKGKTLEEIQQELKGNKIK